MDKQVIDTLQASLVKVHTIFDEATSNATHIVTDAKTGKTAVVDSVLDFDPVSGRTGTASADKVIDYVRENELDVEYVLETHVHADHVTAGNYLKEQLGARMGIGANVTIVQETFGGLFNLGDEFPRDGSQFDLLFGDGDTFTLGGIEVTVLHTPGHTPACVTYLFDRIAVIGDTLFMPDFGTARSDFPGSDPRALYRSIRKILSLPGDTVLYLNHDYPPGDRGVAWKSTVAEERQANIHVHDGVSEDEFVAMREARDKKLDLPRLILPSVQINMRAGVLPPAEGNGVSYLKTPLNAL